MKTHKALPDADQKPVRQIMNHYRPHDGTGLETPMRYYTQLVQAA